jgi:hypothetical protein
MFGNPTEKTPVLKGVPPLDSLKSENILWEKRIFFNGGLLVA